MNISLKIDIPVTGYPTVKINPSVMLYPFYCIEDDVLNPFESFDDSSKVYVRKIIFDNSIKVLNKTKLIESLALVSEESLFSLRRDLTICMSTLDLAKKMNVNFMDTLSRSKSLGDFFVRTTTKSDTIVIKRIMDDSTACIDEYESLITDIENSKVLPKAFVKGQYNSSNMQSLGRLWWLSEMTPHISDAYASNKYVYNHNRYKAGNFSQYRNYYVADSRTEFTDGTL